MTSFTTSEAKANFEDIITRAARGKERILLSRRGRDVAAVVPLEDLKLIESIRKKIESQEDLKAARKSLKEFRNGKTISHEQLKKKLGL